MFDLLSESYQVSLSPHLRELYEQFHCGDEDLDEFFHCDALHYEEELLGKTYCWIDKNNENEIMAMVTLSYNGINLFRLDKTSKNSFQRSIPNSKRHINYPGVLIGRLGVSSKYQGKGYHVGSQILEFLKLWFISDDNKAACRFLLVDAYNNKATLDFYIKNGFRFLFKDEEKEKESYGIPVNEALKSRILFFDLKSL